MEEIKLSIIIPLYNGKQFIKETVDGLLKIKCKKEIIIIDDGSKDGSYDYCQNLWKSNTDVKVFSKKNGGIVDARNFGMKKAKGKYLLFSDHDDVVYPDVVDEAVQNAEEKGLDGIIWSTVRLINNGLYIPCDTVNEDCMVFEDEIENVFIPSMLINSGNKKVSYLGHVWAGIYKRDIIQKNNIFFKKFIDIEDDYLFVFDFLNEASRLMLMHKVGYAWRYNQKSETYRLKYIDHILVRYERFYEYLSQKSENHGISKDVLEKFEVYRVQNTLVMTIENSYTCLNRSKEENVAIRAFYRQNEYYFKKSSVFPYEKRRKRIFACLHYRMFRIATLYVYLDSLYRKLKRS